MARILKMRHARRGLMVGLLGLLLVPFQNCAPAPENSLCASGQTCASESPSKALTAPASTGTGTTTPTAAGSFGPSGGVTSTSGSTTVTPSTGLPSTSGLLNFYKNLSTSVPVSEGAAFTLSVQMSGGMSPYTYTWYLNGAAVTNASGNLPFFSEMATRYQKEGNYTVKVRDAAGVEVTSATANVYFVEPTTGCVAGDYTMMAGNPMPELNLADLYENPRGKFLVYGGYSEIAPLMSSPGYWGISVFRFATVAPHLTVRSMTCSTYIPRFNDPRPYANRSGMTYMSTGAITVECHANKWKLISNTCQWTGRAVISGGGGGNGGSR